MTSQAYQTPGLGSHRRNADARARTYSITGPIRRDCHKLKQSIAHNGIVMMQMLQTCYGQQRQRYDMESANVERSYALVRIMQQRDDAAMRLCAYSHKSTMGLCSYDAMRIKALWGHEAMRLCAYDGSVMMPLCAYARESIERYATMRLCAYDARSICRYAAMRIQRYDDMIICGYAHRRISPLCVKPHGKIDQGPRYAPSRTLDTPLAGSKIF